MRRTMERIGWVAGLVLVPSACAEDSGSGRPRAPADAIPNAVVVAGGTLIEGTATGRIRKSRDASSFRIAKSLVTTGQYRRCVDSGACTRPALESGFCAMGFASAALDGPTFELGDDAVPVTCTSLKQAAAFCRWVGGRLPNPAEWQLAARGPEVRRFSWGTTSPSCSEHWRIAFSSASGACCGSECDNPAVGRVEMRAGGASPSGVMDVLSTRGELLAADKESPWPSCRDSARGCVVTGNAPGAIDVFLPGASMEDAALSAGFRCVWEEAVQ